MIGPSLVVDRRPWVDTRDWLTLFNESWWRPARFGGAWVPPRAWRLIAVDRAPFYVVKGPLQILHCEPTAPITQRIVAEIASRRAIATRQGDAAPTRLELIYLRHDLRLLEALLTPEGLTE